MNTDIRIAVDFFAHHKTRKLKKRIGSDGVLSLIQLWTYAAKIRPDGDLDGMSGEDIELAADWDGEDGAFAAALADVGFLECVDGRFVLHDWVENNPWAVGSDSRSDTSRLSRMSRSFPNEYQTLVQAWIKGISKADYEELKLAKNPSTIVQRIINDTSTTVEQPLNDRKDSVPNRSNEFNERPSPAPSPSPVLEENINTPPLPPTGGNAVGETEQIPPQPIPEQPDVPEGASKPERRKRDPTGNTLPELRQAIAALTPSEPLRKALEDFRAMRERIRKPLTGRGLELLFGKLHELAPGNEAMQVAIVEQSTMNGWQGIFPLNGPMRAGHAVGQLMGKNAQTMAAVLAARQQGRAGNERV
ncbi:MAG: hypothetical protein K2O70_01835 [Desulfovibrionaceae bacterium]|nr:hypothetical protein [Desulfovibrionaceae bacterium]